MLPSVSFVFGARGDAGLCSTEVSLFLFITDQATVLVYATAYSEFPFPSAARGEDCVISRLSGIRILTARPPFTPSRDGSFQLYVGLP